MKGLIGHWTAVSIEDVLYETFFPKSKSDGAFEWCFHFEAIAQVAV